MNHNNHMSKALSLAKYNIEHNNGGPFGAVIVKDDEIIAEGYNEVTNINDPTAHAEIQAIRHACKKLNQFHLQSCTLYSSCEPCPMCLSAIYWAHIDNIYYAATRADAKKIQFDDEFIYDELTKPIVKRRVSMQQLMQSQAVSIFEQWQKIPNKTRY